MKKLFTNYRHLTAEGRLLSFNNPERSMNDVRRAFGQEEWEKGNKAGDAKINKELSARKSAEAPRQSALERAQGHAGAAQADLNLRTTEVQSVDKDNEQLARKAKTKNMAGDAVGDTTTDILKVMAAPGIGLLINTSTSSTNNQIAQNKREVGVKRKAGNASVGEGQAHIG